MLFKSLISTAVFAAAAVADIKFTSWPSDVAAGGTYPLTWTTSDSTAVRHMLEESCMDR